MERRREHRRDFLCVESGNENVFCGWDLLVFWPVGVRLGGEVRDAGTDAEFGPSKVRGQLAQMLDPKRWRKFRILKWQANFFVRFSSSSVKGGFREAVCFAARESGLTGICWIE